ETELLIRAIDRLAERLVDMADLFNGWNRAFPREALERLSSALAELKALREDRSEDLREFEDGYRNAIRVHYNRLDFIGPRDIDARHRRQSLEVSYISLDVEAFAPREANPDAESPEQRASGSGMMTVASAEEILQQARRLVIRGDAGAGKTTLLQWIAVQAASPASPHRPKGWGAVVPFVIKLRTLKAGGGFPSVEEFVAISAENAPRPPSNWVHRQLNAGNALVLIDGVDELPDNDRNDMLEHLDNLIKQFPLSRFVITSRPPALNNWPEWDMFVEAHGLTQVTLRAMGSEQTARFIDHWHSAAEECYGYRHEGGRWAQLPGDLKGLLARGDQAGLRKLAASPLLCAMICALHVDYGANMPTNKIDIYDECLGMLMTDREDKRNIPSTADYPKPGKTERRELAQPLAYHMLDKTLLDMPLEGVDEFFTDQLAHRTTVDWTGFGIRRLFTDRCSLLREPVVGRLDFRHKTFQEFLGAEHARNQHIVLPLAAKSRLDGWRETIVMASALFNRADCEKLLLKMTSSPRKNSRPFTTALACLGSDRVSAEVRTRVLESSSWLFPPTLETAVDVAAAGDQAVPFLEPTGLMTPLGRAACVRALVSIGTPTALGAIERHAASSDFAAAPANDPSWRNFVAELMAGGEQFEAGEYARRALGAFRWCTTGLVVGAGDPPADGESTSERTVWLVSHLLGGDPVGNVLPTAPRAWALARAAALIEAGGLSPADFASGMSVRLRDAFVTILATPKVLPAIERAQCGRALSILGDPRPGVGLRPDGLPDIEWCDVPAGKFVFGGDDKAYGSGPKQIIDLPAFRIARYPVTFIQFKAFLDAADGYGNPRWWEGLHEDAQKQRQAGPHEQRFPFDNHPREMVSWFDAVAYFRWLSSRLGYEITMPTEQQWEKAARGTDGRAFPYGNEFDEAKCNSGQSGISQTSAVGAFPDGGSPYGAMDMSGNVWEWTLTEYDTLQNTNISSNNARVLRGGGWNYNDVDVFRCANRYRDLPGGADDIVGFRGSSGSA
ncbi:MAG: SUMF1/EgtB/PvdO family nonheme iron enzyme, partial [Capsulimonadaceae bacterium]